MSNKIIKSCMALAIAVMMLTATVFADDLANGIDWEKGMIRVTGMGYGKEGAKKGLQRAQATQAARMDAQRKLLEFVEGVNVDAESTMKDLMLDSDIVRTSVHGTLKHFAQIGTPKYYKDGACEVTLEMPLFGAENSVAKSAFIPAKDEPKEPFPQPTTNINVTTTVNTVVGGVASTKYTGLVVDCSGLGLQAVMSPVIKNGNGQPIYGYKNLDIDKVIDMGMASYSTSSNDAVAQARAGSNPLVIKATKVDGTIPGNPVVSVEDANKILIANQVDMFLDNCSVVFVK